MDYFKDVQLTFERYYKFTFTFVAQLPDHSKLYVDYGVDSDDIYKLTVDISLTKTYSLLNPHAARLYKDGGITAEFYDY